MESPGIRAECRLSERRQAWAKSISFQLMWLRRRKSKKAGRRGKQGEHFCRTYNLQTAQPDAARSRRLTTGNRINKHGGRNARGMHEGAKLGSEFSRAKDCASQALGNPVQGCGGRACGSGLTGRFKYRSIVSKPARV